MADQGEAANYSGDSGDDSDSSIEVAYFGTHLSADHVVWTSDPESVPLSAPPLGPDNADPLSDVGAWAASAANALRDADVVFVTAGAGMSAEAGIPTYRGDDSVYAGGWDPAKIEFGGGLEPRFTWCGEGAGAGVAGDAGAGAGAGASASAGAGSGAGAGEGGAGSGGGRDATADGGSGDSDGFANNHERAWAWARSIATSIARAHATQQARRGAYAALREVLLRVGPKKVAGVMCTNIDGLMTSMVMGCGPGWDADPSAPAATGADVTPGGGSDDVGAGVGAVTSAGADTGGARGAALPDTGTRTVATAAPSKARNQASALLTRVPVAELHGFLCRMQHIDGDACSGPPLVPGTPPVITWNVSAAAVARAPTAGLACPVCGAPARPVVSHPSDDPAILRWPRTRDAAMRAVRRRAGPLTPAELVDNASSRTKRRRSRKRRARPRTVVLEVGAGVSIHSVRTEGELLVARGAPAPASVLLRVNPDGHKVPAQRCCAVNAGAKDALAALAVALAAGHAPAAAKQQRRGQRSRGRRKR